MNISRLNIHKILTPLVLLILPLWSSAQVEYIEVLINESAIYEFASCGNAGIIDEVSSNGYHYLNGELNETYGNSGCNSNPNVLEYHPNQGFLGQDTMIVHYYQDHPIFGPIFTEVMLVFDVVPVVVDAVDDYISMSVDSTIIIHVTSNDEANGGDLTLSNIPLVNHGEAFVESDSTISFSPAAGFEGITHFNYNVCDTVHQLCDVAKVTVYVQSNSAVNDTTTLVTLKNQSIDALVPLDDGYQELLAPSKGVVEIMDGRLKYTPDTDSTGLDIFSYLYNTNSNPSIATFIIDVLWPMTQMTSL